MSLTTKNQLLIAYKKLVGKGHTNSQFGDVNEDIGSNIQLDTSTVFSEQVPGVPDPTGSIIVEKIDFELESIALSQYTANGTIAGGITADGDGAPTPGTFSNGYHAFKLKLPSNYTTSSTNTKKGTGFFLDSQVLSDTLGALQIVPSRYGPDYIPEVSSGSTVIYPLDEEDYYLDTYNGVLFLQDVNLTRIPTKVTAYLYTGDFLDKTLEDISGSGLVLNAPEQSVLFNSGSTISGTSNLIYNYNTDVLSGTTAEFNIITGTNISGTTATFSVLSASEVVAKNLHIEYVTSSVTVISQSGPSNFGDSIDDTHVFTGSLIVSGGAITGTIGIGVAEDGDYTDGLFTEFVPTTPLGTAIDKINEILKGLVPPAAPSLQNLESETAVGTAMNLSFGASSPTASYINVTASLAGLTTVDIGNPFQLTNGIGGAKIRLGVFANIASINLTLNNSTIQNAGTYVNYPENAFNVATDGVGQYILEVNGNQIIPSGSTIDTGSYNANNFTLSTANTGTFPETGLSIALFANRTGSVSIPTALWQNGHNYVKVTHISALGTHTTNYIDWVYDPQAAATGPAYVFSTPTSSSFSLTGEKDLSGIKYYTGVSYDFSCSVTNYYKNCYPTADNAGITFGNLTSGLSATGFTGGAPIPSTAEDILQRSSAHSVASIRLLGNALSSTMNVANGLGKTGSTTLTTLKILLDKVNTANTSLVENFCLEDFRVSSASYDTQSSLSTAAAFPSASALGTAELAVYNGAVRYPTQVLNNGDVEGARTALSVTHMIASQPDYSSATQDRTYFRKFVNGSNSKAQFNLTFTGANTNFVSFGTALTGNNIKVSVKVPGKTGWRDIKTAVPSSTSGIALNDGVGCLQGSGGSNLTSEAASTFIIQLRTEGLAPSEVFAVRIQASKDWAGYIKKLEIV